MIWKVGMTHYKPYQPGSWILIRWCKNCPEVQTELLKQQENRVSHLPIWCLCSPFGLQRLLIGVKVIVQPCETKLFKAQYDYFPKVEPFYWLIDLLNKVAVSANGLFLSFFSCTFLCVKLGVSKIYIYIYIFFFLKEPHLHNKVAFLYGKKIQLKH